MSSFILLFDWLQSLRRSVWYLGWEVIIRWLLVNSLDTDKHINEHSRVWFLKQSLLLFCFALFLYAVLRRWRHIDLFVSLRTFWTIQRVSGQPRWHSETLSKDQTLQKTLGEKIRKAPKNTNNEERRVLTQDTYVWAVFQDWWAVVRSLGMEEISTEGRELWSCNLWRRFKIQKDPAKWADYR